MGIVFEILAASTRVIQFCVRISREYRECDDN